MYLQHLCMLTSDHNGAAHIPCNKRIKLDLVVERRLHTPIAIPPSPICPKHRPPASPGQPWAHEVGEGPSSAEGSPSPGGGRSQGVALGPQGRIHSTPSATGSATRRRTPRGVGNEGCPWAVGGQAEASTQCDASRKDDVDG